MRKVFFMTFCLFVFARICAQENCNTIVYHRLQADSLYKTKNYEAVLKHLQAIERDTFFGKLDLYKMAVCFFHTNQLDNCQVYFAKAIDKGIRFRSMALLKRAELYKYFKKVPNFAPKLDTLRNSTLSYARKKEYDKFFQAVIKRDQRFRKIDYSRLSTPQRDSLWNIQAQIDGQNRVWLDSFVKENGWPIISNYGEIGNKTAWLIVQHADADLKFQTTYLDGIQRLSKVGESNPINFAYLYDRVLINNGKPQKFGTQLYIEHVGGQTKIRTKAMENEGCVDYYRLSYGLSILADYLKFARGGLPRRK